MTDLYTLTATEAAAAMARGDFSARDLMESCLAHVKDRDRAVEAWIYLNEEQALAAADAADAARKNGADGPMLGIPVGLKDIIDTKDMPTANGSEMFAGRRPATDSTIARLLREAGAIIMGKTVTTEFALSAAGKTKNPHNPAHTPGGSSSGSAASVADSQVPLAIGTQTGGSMIRPASYCGCYGYKPTYGSISRAGMFCLSRVLDHPGIYSRSIADLALIGDVLTHKDPADLDMRPHLKANLVESVSAGAPNDPPRIAFIKGPSWSAVDPYMDALFDGVCDKLGDAVQSVELAGVFDDALSCHATVMFGQLAANLEEYCEETEGKVRDETKRRYKDGVGLSAAEYIRAFEFRDTLQAAVDKMFDHFDILLTAAAPGEAPEGLESTGNPIFQKIWTLTGVPTVTLPKLTGPTGLPIGVQVIGRYGQDGDLLKNALWIDEAI